MTDVHEIDSATGDESATPRRRRRATGTATTATRRRRLRGSDLVESLRESVEQLIRENRSLKRQLAKATAGGASSAAPAAARTLRSLQRQVAQAAHDHPERLAVGVGELERAGQPLQALRRRDKVAGQVRHAGGLQVAVGEVADRLPRPVGDQLQDLEGWTGEALLELVDERA